MEITLHKGEIPDAVLNDIAQIYIDCFTGPPRFETWTLDLVKTHMLKFLESGADFFVLTDDDGEISAFAIGIAMDDYYNKDELMEQGASPNSYYFAELGTSPKARGRGYGGSLHEARENEALRRNFKLLNVRVRQDNDVNIRLLNKRGFKTVGEYTGVIQGVESAKYVLAKELG